MRRKMVKNSRYGTGEKDHEIEKILGKSERKSKSERQVQVENSRLILTSMSEREKGAKGEKT